MIEVYHNINVDSEVLERQEKLARTFFCVSSLLKPHKHDQSRVSESFHFEDKKKGNLTQEIDENLGDSGVILKKTRLRLHPIQPRFLQASMLEVQK